MSKLLVRKKIGKFFLMVVLVVLLLGTILQAVFRHFEIKKIVITFVSETKYPKQSVDERRTFRHPATSGTSKTAVAFYARRSEAPNVSAVTGGSGRISPPLPENQIFRPVSGTNNR